MIYFGRNRNKEFKGKKSNNIKSKMFIKYIIWKGKI